MKKEAVKVKYMLKPLKLKKKVRNEIGIERQARQSKKVYGKMNENIISLYPFSLLHALRHPLSCFFLHFITLLYHHYDHRHHHLRSNVVILAELTACHCTK